VPESGAPNIRNRSYTIAAEMDIETPEASGVIFSQGSRFGGHALYVKDGRLKYVYNFIGELEQIVESDQTIPSGHVVLSASFEKQADTMPSQGPLRVYIRDQKVGEDMIRTQPGKFGLGGGGLVVGRSGAEPVSDDYAGEAPWPFVGGTIKRVVIDVSGEAFVDLATEARAAFARQ
jgi:arylsulfatase